MGKTLKALAMKARALECKAGETAALQATAAGYSGGRCATEG